MFYTGDPRLPSEWMFALGMVGGLSLIAAILFVIFLRWKSARTRGQTKQAQPGRQQKSRKPRVRKRRR